MNDDELRLLIRAAIQRHVGSAPSIDVQAPQPPVVAMSFGQYRIERSAGDTSCIIEPSVQCNHCGFCKCHGH